MLWPCRVRAVVITSLSSAANLFLLEIQRDAADAAVLEQVHCNAGGSLDAPGLRAVAISKVLLALAEFDARRAAAERVQRRRQRLRVAAGGAADQGVFISHMFQEVESGPMPLTESRDRRMGGGYTPTALYLDAKSAFAATTAAFIKSPVEKSLLCHTQYLRELFDKDTMCYLLWVDTRDMAADGMTKGSVDRIVLHVLMDGKQPLQHAYEQWKSKQCMKLADDTTSSKTHSSEEPLSSLLLY